ncbi:MAG: hypothetical protein Q8N96_13615 [Methylovulum sp.]|nr:hypothetical protein [Methylovulum sp.]
MQPETLQRPDWQRWSIAGCVPTLERGNDANHSGFALARRTGHPPALPSALIAQ